MSRTLDPDILTWLRDLEARIRQLEGGNARHNDVRIGNLVLSTDQDTNQIRLENIRSRETVVIGGNEKHDFTFNGLVTVSGTAALNYTPPYMVTSTTLVQTITMSLSTAPSSAISVQVLTNDNQFATTVTLPAGSTSHSVPVSIPVQAGTHIRVLLTDDGAGTSYNLTVSVLFGTPTADPTPNEI